MSGTELTEPVSDYASVRHPRGAHAALAAPRASTAKHQHSLAQRLLAALSVGAALLLIWWFLCKFRILNSSVFPTPGAVAGALKDEMQSGRLWDDLIASLFRVSAGFFLAVVLAIPTGLWLGSHAISRAAWLPEINFMRSLSPLAWIPFAIVWFGIGDASSIFLIFLATFFPLTLATLSAVAGIPRTYFRVARDYGIKGVELLMKVTLPAILPQVITALRVTAGLAWLVVVAAEMIAGHDGLGFAIWDARNGLRMDLLVAEMLVIGLLGIGIDLLLLSLTKFSGVRWGYEQ